MAGMLRHLVRTASGRGGAAVAGRRLRPGRDVLAGERDGLAVLLDLRRELYLGLDEVGTAIWQEVERGSAPEAIVDSVCRDFDAPRDVVQRDVDAFIEALVRDGLAVRQ